MKANGGTVRAKSSAGRSPPVTGGGQGVEGEGVEEKAWCSSGR
jgi:hypothetical protein